MTTRAETYQPHAFARADRSRMGIWWWTVDHWLLGATALLILTGVILSFTSSPAAAARLHLDDPFHFAERQCFFGAGGALVVLAISSLSARGVRRAAVIIYGLMILLMMALPVVGHSAKGAARWFQVAGFSLQPSEFMKPALIVLCGWMFAEGQKGQGVPGVSIAFGLYGLAVALLLMEPDVGQTILITVAFGAAFFMAGVPIRWILGMAGAAGGGAIAIYFSFRHVSNRVHLFLSKDGTDTHQVDKALDAIAGGGLFGRGPGEGVLKRHIPDAHTDFAYSAAAEEYGLIFSLALISLIAFVVVRGLYKSMRLSDPYEQVAAAE